MDIDKDAYEAGKTASKAKKTPKKKPISDSQAAAFDLTADYIAGRTLADQKLQAFNKGLKDRLKEARAFASVEFSNSSFELPASPFIKMLPPSEEEEEEEGSFMGLLYGYQTVEITQV